MARANELEDLVKTRRQIAAKVRALRQARKWTQADLGKWLQLSQNRLSDIERGDGSFTAEQFLLLSKLFNVAPGQFVRESNDPGLVIQNALARLGALHVQESVHVLPSEEIQEVHDVVREALLDGSPRNITALAPVLVRNAERMNLAKLHAELESLGRDRRLAWVIDNTIAALAQLSHGSRDAKQWSKLHRRAELELGLFLGFVDPPPGRQLPADILDATIRSRRTLDEVQRTASKQSQRWAIVTSLQPEDFLEALRAAGAAH
jgi:transcriptional regulator with XRE-family HTH domain